MRDFSRAPRRLPQSWSRRLDGSFGFGSWLTQINWVVSFVSSSSTGLGSFACSEAGYSVSSAPRCCKKLTCLYVIFLIRYSDAQLSCVFEFLIQ
jgi:hypothetical protein